MSTLKVVPFPFGIYAIIVWPSLVLEVVVSVDPDP
jgi:hypothetical protein